MISPHPPFNINCPVDLLKKLSVYAILANEWSFNKWNKVNYSYFKKATSCRKYIYFAVKIYNLQLVPFLEVSYHIPF